MTADDGADGIRFSGNNSDVGAMGNVIIATRAHSDGIFIGEDNGVTVSDNLFTGVFWDEVIDIDNAGKMLAGAVIAIDRASG